MTCAIYIRVSESAAFRRDPANAERAQTQETENQRLVLEKYAADREWKVYKVYDEHASAGSGKDRPVFASMMADAAKRKFGVLLFWALDRFSREGTTSTLMHLQRLDKLGVAYCSYQEQHIDSAGPFREAFVGIIAALAKMERERQSERVKAGLSRRRSQGGHVGRVPRYVDCARLKQCLAAGFSHAQTALAFGVARSTAAAYVRLYRAGNLAEIERRNALALAVAGRRDRAEALRGAPGGGAL